MPTARGHRLRPSLGRATASARKLCPALREPTYLAGESAGPETAKPAVTRAATSLSSKLNLCVAGSVGGGRSFELHWANKYKMLPKRLQPCEASAMPVVTYAELNMWPARHRKPGANTQEWSGTPDSPSSLPCCWTGLLTVTLQFCPTACSYLPRSGLTSLGTRCER